MATGAENLQKIDSSNLNLPTKDFSGGLDIGNSKDNSVDSSNFNVNNYQGVAKSKLTREDKTAESSEKSLEDQSKMFLNMMIIQLKNQDPENPTDSSQMTQTHAMMNNAMEATKQTRALEKMQNNMEKAALDQNQTYLGHEVYYEDNTRFTEGSPVEFNFDIDYDKNNLSDSQGLYANIVIKNSEDETVFHQENVPSVPGKNSFNWAAIDNNFEKVPPDSYKLEVDAYVQDQNAISDFDGYYEVPASTKKHGKVTSIESRGFNDVALKLDDGEVIGKDQVTGIAAGGDSNSRGSSGLGPYESINYIDKQATVSRNDLKINSSYADVKFYNPIKNHGSGKIEVKNEGGEIVATDIIEQDKLKYGENEFEWHALKTRTMDEIKAKRDTNSAKELSPLQDGNYKVTYSVEDNDEKVEKEIDTTYTGRVEKVNLEENSIEIDGEEYKFSDIIAFGSSEKGNNNINSPNGIKSSFLAEANRFIGRGAIVRHDLIEYDGGAEEVPTQLSRPSAIEEGSQYGKLRLNVYNQNGDKIATREKSSSEVNYLGKVSVPKFEEFSQSSREQINEFIKTEILDRGGENNNGSDVNATEGVDGADNRGDQDSSQASSQQSRQDSSNSGTGSTLYYQLEGENKQAADEYIRNNFYTGNLITTEMEKMPESAREKELQKIQGVNFINWDGKADGGEAKVPSGQYKYDFELEIFNPTTQKRRTESFTNNNKVEITSVMSSDEGSIVLEGADGTRFYPEQITSLTKIG
jgi:flagellar basal-body rod modification protein FlgD